MLVKISPPEKKVGANLGQAKTPLILSNKCQKMLKRVKICSCNI